MSPSKGDGKRGQGRALILVENAAIPYDRRVMAEANSLLANGYAVSIICPTASQQPARESLGGVLVRRYRSRPSRGGAASQVAEYLVALVKTFALMVSLSRDPGFDVIHACNPPDTFVVIGLVYRLLGKRFIFDQHDLCPEVYLSKFPDKAGALAHRLLLYFERLTYRAAHAVISMNESYRQVALERGTERGVVQDMLGHKTEAMTRRYAGSLRQHNAAKKMPNVSPI